MYEIEMRNTANQLWARDNWTSEVRNMNDGDTIRLGSVDQSISGVITKSAGMYTLRTDNERIRKTNATDIIGISQKKLLFPTRIIKAPK